MRYAFIEYINSLRRVFHTPCQSLSWTGRSLYSLIRLFTSSSAHTFTCTLSLVCPFTHALVNSLGHAVHSILHGRGNATVTDSWRLHTINYSIHFRGGDVAQLVERRIGTPLTQVRFPDEARDFSPRVTFQCRLSYVCPYTPRMQSHALTSVRTL